MRGLGRGVEGLKIRRASALGGSIPPPGTTPKPLWNHSLAGASSPHGFHEAGPKSLHCAQFVPLSAPVALLLAVFPAPLGSPIPATSESHHSYPSGSRLRTAQ